MNDPNPYDAPAEGSKRGDRFWVGFIIGVAACFAVMFALLLMAGGFLFFVNVSSTPPPSVVPIAGPGGTEGGVDVLAEPEPVQIEIVEPAN